MDLLRIVLTKVSKQIAKIVELRGVREVELRGVREVEMKGVMEAKETRD